MSARQWSRHEEVPHPWTVRPFADAHAAATVALNAATETLEHLRDADPAARTMDFSLPEAVTGGFPLHPLDTAVRDLAVATHAGGRAAEAAAHSGSGECAERAAEAARQAARTLSFAENVATHADLRAQAQAQVAVAHAAATTAFNAAALLDCWPAPAGGAPGTRFPEFWRDLIDRLAAAIRGCEAGADADDRPLLEAACVARDAAQAAVHAYERDSVWTASRRPCGRFVRISALVAAYAGCAALLPLRESAEEPPR